jgi:hypothetical protein
MSIFTEEAERRSKSPLKQLIDTLEREKAERQPIVAECWTCAIRCTHSETDYQKMMHLLEDSIVQHRAAGHDVHTREDK